MKPKETRTTVCIAANTSIHREGAFVLCADMMGSSDWSTSENTWKMHALCRNVYGLIAGPVSTARELTYHCVPEVKGASNIPEMLQALRNGVGKYKRAFVEAHVQSRFGLDYEEFMDRGAQFLAQDVHREACWEIKNHFSQAELIVAAFFQEMGQTIFKITADSVITCDDFAVIGSGTAVAESFLNYRSQNMYTPLKASLYNVYEAKRLAETAPGVGKKTKLVVRQRDSFQFVLQAGLEALRVKFEEYGPRPPVVEDLDLVEILSDPQKFD